MSGSYVEPETGYPGQGAGQHDGVYNRLVHATDGSDKVYGGDWQTENNATDAYVVPSSDGYILADYSGGMDLPPDALYEDVYHIYPDVPEFLEDGVTPNPEYDPDTNGVSLTETIYGYISAQYLRIVIKTMDDTPMNTSDVVKIGSHVFGRKFTMPTAPNMSLTQSYEFGGTKTQTSLGGSTLTNTAWHSPPNWGDLPAWGRNNTGLDGLRNQRNFLGGRRGRRTWNLKFAFMSEDKVFPEYILKSDGVDGFHDMSGIIDLATDTHSASSTLYGILSLTLGGVIPFIFQPDKDEDNFAIVRFDQKSIKFTQSSHRTYDFSCKLVEQW